MAEHQKIHETNGNIRSSVCKNLGIHSFNKMTSSEYPAYEYYQQKKEVKPDKIYNHDLLF